MTEEPLWQDDFYYHSMLQKRLKTMIGLGESIRNGRDALTTIEMKSCEIINIRLGRVGGFSEAITVCSTAQEQGFRYGTECWRRVLAGRITLHCQPPWRLFCCRVTFRHRALLG